MKSNRKTKKNDYTRIKRKLYLRVLLALIAAVVIVVLLRVLLQGQGLSNLAVFLLVSIFRVENDTAERIYQYVVRNNMDIFILAAIIVCFFILCRMILSSFMKYFDEIDAGIDALFQGEGKPIELSDEMAFMEQKLNILKLTLEKREQDAKLADRRKNDLVMFLAHDIKTPLTSVVGYLSLIHEAPDMPAEQRAKYVNITLEKAYRLEELIDEFFEITRYNLQTMSLSGQVIDLYYMLTQMTDEFYPQLAANGKKAVIHAPEDITVFGDPDKLARVFNNVLKNAVAYSPDNSVIDITASVADNRVSVAFTNDGTIPKNKLMSIFDKFYRLDSSRSSDSGGAGLGLAIAKEIVTSHGGQIRAESDGERTTFIVELPAMPPVQASNTDA